MTNRQMTKAHSLHEVSNDNRCKLIYFAMNKGMVISSTYLRNCIKRTQASPNGTIFNHTDHTLRERQFASSILDVRSYHGASCDSDHYLVNIHYRYRANISRPINEQIWKVRTNILSACDT
jgi:hypothetical protein